MEKMEKIIETIKSSNFDEISISYLIGYLQAELNFGNFKLVA